MALGLALLALIDSTSFGTLALPFVLVIQPTVPYRQLTTYLAVVASCYYALGVALLFAGSRVRAALAGWTSVWESAPVIVVEFLLGAALAGMAIILGRRTTDGRAEGNGRGARSQARYDKWRARLIGQEASLRLTAVIALGAVAVEAASMAPYLAAMASLSSAVLGVAETLIVLTTYVGVMLLPISWCTVVRTFAGPRSQARLLRADAWFGQHGATAVRLSVGIIGLIVAVHAVSRGIGAG